KLHQIDDFSCMLSDLRKLRRAEFDKVLAERLVKHDVTILIKEDIYQLAEPTIFEIFKLLFFGNLSQDLTEFVLNDLGLSRYEPYLVDKSARLFNSRQQIDK